jgi:hypothetical protein
MAIFSNVNVGTAPNDGTGDSLRTSFIKVNGNFQDILSIWPNVSENEIFANITSTGISYFNLVEAETLSGNTLSSESGNINVTVSNVNISGGNLSVSGTITSTGTITAPTFSGNISGTTGTYTGTVTAPTFSGNITGTTVTLTGNITANTLIGNISGTTGIFTGNIFTNLIDSADSSAITVTPATIFSSDVIVENDLAVTQRFLLRGSRVLNLTDLKAVVAASSSFADFQTRIAALV